MNISFLINYECISGSLSAVYMFVVACAKYYRNCVPKNALKYHKHKTLNKTPFTLRLVLFAGINFSDFTN